RARNPSGPFFGERWAGFVCEHVLTRSVRDSAAALDVTRGPDPGAPYQVRPPARPYLEEDGADPGKLRVAFTTDAHFGESIHDDNAAAVRAAAALAEELGHTVAEDRPTFDKQALVRAYLTVVTTGTHLGVDEAGALSGRKPK